MNWDRTKTGLACPAAGWEGAHGATAEERQSVSTPVGGLGRRLLLSPAEESGGMKEAADRGQGGEDVKPGG